MWKKDEIQGTETATQPQAPSKPIARSEPPRAVATGDRANIGRSITVKGDISGDEDLNIQGAVDGSVKLKEHNVTIASEGRVTADVHGRTITVQGQVEGDLFGGEQVILSPSCRVRGNITAPRVALEDGANFRGTIDMDAKAGDSAVSPKRTPHPQIGKASDAAKVDGAKK